MLFEKSISITLKIVAMKNYFKLSLVFQFLLMIQHFDTLAQATRTEVEAIGSKCETFSDFEKFSKIRTLKNIDSLIAIGKSLSSTQKSGGSDPAVLLEWPLRMTADYESTSGVYELFRVTNYLDLDPDTSGRLDWICNTGDYARNYNGHNGVDISSSPFGWQNMDDQVADVIAAANGTVVDIYDGAPYDRNCIDPDIWGDSTTFNGGVGGNYVNIMHADGSMTRYSHLKIGSVANLVVGDTVLAGQYLGKVGASGNAKGPHLHFAVYMSVASNNFEPWYDPSGCNSEISESRWVDQKPYYDPALMRISTHDADPVLKTCEEYEAGENEDVYICNHFSEGSTMYISVTMRDYLPSDDITVNILNSSGTVLETFTHESEYYSDGIRIEFETELDSYADGQYRIRVLHNGSFYYHFFTVGCIDTYGLSGAVIGTRGWLAGNNISSTATVSGSSSNNIRYEAENYITLNPGFHIASNAQLTAKINACTLGGAKVTQENTVQQNASLLLYPNPTEGECTIHFSASVNLSTNTFVRIFNAEGKLIWENIIPADETLLQCDLSQFPKGLYTVTAQNETEFYTQKLVLQ